MQEGNVNTVYASIWTLASLSGSSGGSVRHTGAAGAKAIYSSTGKEVSWTTKGANHGRAEVWLDGAKEAEVDLHAGSTQPDG